MRALGDQLGRARRAYDDALGKLSTGSGNLVRQTEMLKALGARTAKTLPLLTGSPLQPHDGDAPDGTLALKLPIGDP